MAETVAALALLGAYGVWFLALVREQRQREAFDRMTGLFAALVPAAEQAARDIADVGRAFGKLSVAARRWEEASRGRS